MAILSKRKILDRGAPIAGKVTNELVAWNNAFFRVFVGTSESPVNLGFFLERINRTVTGATVTSDQHTAALPGPIMNIQATAGTLTGIKSILVTGTPASGEALVETGADGVDTITFAAVDGVTTCAYRQLAMPTEMIDALTADSEPPIEE